MTKEVVQEALIDWSEHAVFFDRFAGPTTRLAIRRYKGEKVEKSGGVELVTRQATNGAAMKISPIGLLNAGNIEQAIADAVTVTMVTHDNYLAISGACAVTAAVSRAVMPDVDVYSVLQAGLYGAREGERIGREVARDVAGAWEEERLGRRWWRSVIESARDFMSLRRFPARSGCLQQMKEMRWALS